MSQLMHTGEKQSDQLKAADMLAKHHGLLTPREETGFDPELILAIEAAVAEIAAEYHEPDPDPEGGHPPADDPAGPGGPLVRP
ncbi:MAG: hypothetical protein IJE07_12140 [Clostridia bacterium]|nr:hypothetical protein [Clostridia bacterium]